MRFYFIIKKTKMNLSGNEGSKRKRVMYFVHYKELSDSKY